MTVPSEFDHMMTIGEFAICPPKPLSASGSAETRAYVARNSHGHEPEVGLAEVHEGVWEDVSLARSLKNSDNHLHCVVDPFTIP